MVYFNAATIEMIPKTRNNRELKKSSQPNAAMIKFNAIDKVKKAVIIIPYFICLAEISPEATILFSPSLLFLVLGIISIVAALKYTIGKNAYGYSGLGDVFVFLFFGLLSVLGSNYLFTHELKWDLLLPASSIGLFSMAVLNLNNMRDIENDKKNKKNTLVVSLGSLKAKIYHYILISLGMVLTLLYSGINYHSINQFTYCIAFIPLWLNLVTVYKNKEPKLLDKELKKVALSTFLFAILFGFSLNI